MCRLYALRASVPTRVECSLVRAQNNLMRQSLGDSEGQDHLHGWGVADYKNGLPLIEKDAWAAGHGEFFSKKAARVHAETVVAHVRRATVGPSVPENTHPFGFGRFVFAHNGTLPGFDTLRKKMLDHIDPLHRAEIRGQTDSEHIFHYLLTLWSHGPQGDILETLRLGLERILGWCREVAPDRPVGLNVILTDGQCLVGSRMNRTLWFLERAEVFICDICGHAHAHDGPVAGYRAVEVASEPLTPADPWKAVPNGTVYAADPDFRLRFLPLRLPTAVAPAG